MSSLTNTIQSLLAPGKGILAADETPGHLDKEFAALGMVSTPDTHQVWRELLFSTPGINKYISGVILSDETIHQSTKTGIPFAQFLGQQGIVPGIKVDGGLGQFQDSNIEKLTNGLEGLPERLQSYYEMGARFAKWRATFTITDELPSFECVSANAESLAEYAYFCQKHGLVPIVEPEVLMDGKHTMERCYDVTSNVLKEVFVKLNDAGINLKEILLKPNMILPGDASGIDPDPGKVAQLTIRCFKEHVPPAVPGIVFLSGGQSEELAVRTLNEIVLEAKGAPWDLTYSYGRALQTSALQAWMGQQENIALAQEAFIKQAEQVHRARLGQL